MYRFAATLLFFLGVPAAVFAASACEDLSKVSLPNTTITMAQTVAAGAFTAPAGRGGGGANPFATLPAFCRVQATLKPSSDSDIKMELWLPVAASWNGRLRGTGNGGLGGGAAVNANALANGLRLGYATAGNNTGHEGDSSYAIDHPEKIKDFGYRAAHEMTVTSKALIKVYYDTPLKYSVMAEGGGGTIAALSSAQRFPEDYDVIAITGMSSYLSRHTFGQMWYWQATHKEEASFIPPDKYRVLHEAALNACDAKDGLKDGLIGNPESCKFDPIVVQCKDKTASNCLTAAQVEAARKIYSGPINPRTRQEIYSPMYPGSEMGWAQLAGGEQPQ
jgi:feruloyl esterase